MELFKSQPSTQASEEPWWESFKSQPSTQESTQASNFELTQQSQSNQEKDENDDEDDEKVSFYLKIGKYKKFKYMYSYFFSKLIKKWIMLVEIE